jgi:hypothetical protein
MNTTELQAQNRIPFPKDFVSKEDWNLYLIGIWLASERAKQKTLTKSFAVALVNLLAASNAVDTLFAFCINAYNNDGWGDERVALSNLLWAYRSVPMEHCAAIAPTFAVSHPNLADAIAAAANGNLHEAENAIERASKSGELNAQRQVVNQIRATEVSSETECSCRKCSASKNKPNEERPQHDRSKS